MSWRWTGWTRVLAMALVAAGCSATPAASPSTTAAPAASPAAPSAAPSPLVTPEPSDPATGFYDIGGGEKLWLECRGTGSPTIVIDVGNDDTIHGSWDAVFGPMSQVSHVCAYDRAFLGKSDPAPGPRTVADIAEELVKLLHATALKGPFVFVGGSFGGNVLIVLAAAHPDLVAGSVFVDSEPANADPKLDPLRSNLPAAQYAACCKGFGPPALDSPDNTEHIDYAGGAKVEIASIGKQPKVPTIILTAKDYECQPDWPCDAIVKSEIKLQGLLIADNPKGTQKLIDSGHVMQREAPEAIVDAARSIVEALRAS
jgi:pimeloyl-ACP methyl ester carboxylesterase